MCNLFDPGLIPCYILDYHLLRLYTGLEDVCMSGQGRRMVIEKRGEYAWNGNKSVMDDQMDSGA